MIDIVKLFDVLLFVLIVTCRRSVQQSADCPMVIVIRNAQPQASVLPIGGSATMNSAECKQICFRNSSCEMSARDSQTRLCKMYNVSATEVSSAPYGESYYFHKSSSPSSCQCENDTVNEWYPSTDTALVSRFALIPMNQPDVVNCALANLNNDFVFDFSGPEAQRCFQITGRGDNGGRSFSSKTYIFFFDDKFFNKCSVPKDTPASLPPPTPPTPTPTRFSTTSQQPTTAALPQPTTAKLPTVSDSLPSTTTKAGNFPHETNTTNDDDAYEGYSYNFLQLYNKYGTMTIRPAYVVLAGLGGACLVMTLVALVALFQGKLGGGVRRAKRMKYDEENSGAVQNSAYDDDLKDERHEDDNDGSNDYPDHHTEDTTLNQMEYANKAEAMAYEDD